MPRTITKYLIAFLTVIFIALTPFWASEITNHDESIGKVTRIQKSAMAIQDALPRTLMVGANNFQGDVISAAHASMVIETPTATIGIRGTTAWIDKIGGQFSIALMSGKSIIVENNASGGVIDTQGFETIDNSKTDTPTTSKSGANQRLKKRITSQDLVTKTYSFSDLHFA